MISGQLESVCIELWSLWAWVWHFHLVNGCLSEVPVERATRVCNQIITFDYMAHQQMFREASQKAGRKS